MVDGCEKLVGVEVVGKFDYVVCICDGVGGLVSYGVFL